MSEGATPGPEGLTLEAGHVAAHLLARITAAGGRQSAAIDVIADNRMHESGFTAIDIAKQNGGWTMLDDIDKEIIPDDLQDAFDRNPAAFENYKNFAPSYRKSYLYWLKQAKRDETRAKRIVQIIERCQANLKERG